MVPITWCGTTHNRNVCRFLSQNTFKFESHIFHLLPDYCLAQYTLEPNATTTWHQYPGGKMAVARQRRGEKKLTSTEFLWWYTSSFARNREEDDFYKYFPSHEEIISFDNSISFLHHPPCRCFVFLDWRCEFLSPFSTCSVLVSLVNLTYITIISCFWNEKNMITSPIRCLNWWRGLALNL